jgi:hypothetical protein
MINAYFNDCLPTGLASYNYSQALEQTARGFKRLRDNLSECSNLLGGIVTNLESSQYIIDGDRLTLGQCISNIYDRELRRLLMYWMSYYPETTFFEDCTGYEDAILNENYYIAYDTPANAINLILAKNSGMFLFSLNLGRRLAVDQLEVYGESKNVLVENLYGNEDSNIAFITNFLQNEYNKTLDTYSQIDKILKHTVKHSAYDSEYSKLSDIEQTAILNRWKEAEGRKLLNPFMPNDDVIKKTNGPAKDEKHVGPIYELRVRQPRELRVYFQLVDGVYYLLNIGDKTNQDMDIKSSFAKAKTLRKL